MKTSKTLEMTQTRTRTIQNGIRTGASGVPVTSTLYCLEEETGGFLTGVTLDSKHNLSLGEIMQPAEETF
jgi:hypothetical protein